jgi:hypothetical protein
VSPDRLAHRVVAVSRTGTSIREAKTSIQHSIGLVMGTFRLDCD